MKGVKMKMKKITILAILFTFMLTAGGYAQTIWTHTAVKTASAKIGTSNKATVIFRHRKGAASTAYSIGADLFPLDVIFPEAMA